MVLKLVQGPEFEKEIFGVDIAFYMHDIHDLSGFLEQPCGKVVSNNNRNNLNASSAKHCWGPHKLYLIQFSHSLGERAFPEVTDEKKTEVLR